MVVGLIAFAIVAVAVEEQIADQTDLTPVLLLVLALWVLGDLIAYLILRRFMTPGIRRLLDEGGESSGLTERLKVLWIISAAMAEGVGLLAIVIFLLTGNAIVLAAAAVAMLILLSLFPTRDRVAQFLSRLQNRPFGQ